ncbi:HAD hydrolase-like protein [Streptosporangium fragile]
MAFADGGWTVGDHLVADIGGGWAAGLRTIWIDRGRGPAKSPRRTTSSWTCFRRWRFSSQTGDRPGGRDGVSRGSC